MDDTPYSAMISSDWNQCLAPCGPFDPLVHAYPAHALQLAALFDAYTANTISLSQAAADVIRMQPEPLTTQQMDAYLDAAFKTYDGVVEFLNWCRDHHILFMINSTGMTAYFQRVFARGLLPRIPALASSPVMRYRRGPQDPPMMLDLTEIDQKGVCTAQVLRHHGVSAKRCIILGDSGGDGPHFQWGARNGAYLIGCMPKPSLLHYCRQAGISIDMLCGQANASFDLMSLTPAIQQLIHPGH